MRPATLLVATALLGARANAAASSAADRQESSTAPPGPPEADVSASASSDVPEGDTQTAPPPLETLLTGYLDQRFTGQSVRTGDLLPAGTVPQFLNLTEANMQVKLRWGEKGLVLGDVSFFYQLAAAFPRGSTPPAGDPPRAPAADLYQPASAISELYGSYSPWEQVNLTFGKKRVVWGPGMFSNPTDILNPPKDPTDPTQQRVGAWLARLELPSEHFTLTLVGAAQALSESGGVPSALLYHSRFDPANDGQAHLALAARLYLLVADTDVNLIYYFTNRYNDLFEDKSRFGLTFSRLLGKYLEFHFEGLGQLGTNRPLVAGDCVRSATALSSCAAAGRVLTYPGLEGTRPAIRLVLGGTYNFPDDSTFSFEYARYTDVYRSSWQAILQGLTLVRDEELSPSLLLGGGSSTGPTAPTTPAPQAFVFESMRRHYIFAMYSKPRIRDDFTFSVTAIGSLEDLSFQLTPNLAWSATEWLTLKVQVFLPTPPIFPTEVGGQSYGEMNLSPTNWRVLLSARLFY
jgi:hypothetical protein